MAASLLQSFVGVRLQPFAYPTDAAVPKLISDGGASRSEEVNVTLNDVVCKRAGRASRVPGML